MKNVTHSIKEWNDVVLSSRPVCCTSKDQFKHLIELLKKDDRSPEAIKGINDKWIDDMYFKNIVLTIQQGGVVVYDRVKTPNYMYFDNLIVDINKKSVDLIENSMWYRIIKGELAVRCRTKEDIVNLMNDLFNDERTLKNMMHLDNINADDLYKTYEDRLIVRLKDHTCLLRDNNDYFFIGINYKDLKDIRRYEEDLREDKEEEDIMKPVITKEVKYVEKVLNDEVFASGKLIKFKVKDVCGIEEPKLECLISRLENESKDGYIRGIILDKFKKEIVVLVKREDRTDYLRLNVDFIEKHFEDFWVI